MDCNNQVNMTPGPLLSTLNMFFSSPCQKKKKNSSPNKLIPQLLLTAYLINSDIPTSALKLTIMNFVTWDKIDDPEDLKLG